MRVPTPLLLIYTQALHLYTRADSPTPSAQSTHSRPPIHTHSTLTPHPDLSPTQSAPQKNKHRGTHAHTPHTARRTHPCLSPSHPHLPVPPYATFSPDALLTYSPIRPPRPGSPRFSSPCQSQPLVSPGSAANEPKYYDPHPDHLRPLIYTSQPPHQTQCNPSPITLPTLPHPPPTLNTPSLYLPLSCYCYCPPETARCIPGSDNAGFSPLWHVWFSVALLASLGVAQSCQRHLRPLPTPPTSHPHPPANATSDPCPHLLPLPPCRAPCQYQRTLATITLTWEATRLS
ncbi:uncharacterized protein LOC135103905 [Scylla paramamosain]|uniref:uncharacterized protein LOC135103905 n=1 Tax=Scylla paramamosain TaxID=85552 RepID=UPI0030830DDA